MYDSYPVREAEAEALRDFIDIEYRFDEFEYFLEQIELTADSTGRVP
jgi:hypothetical protein